MEAASLQLLENYLLAILLGALMGLERERKDTRLAGLRTFILTTLFGTICSQISISAAHSWILFGGIIAVTVQSAMVHFLRFRADISAGLTTSVALLTAYGIGVLIPLGQSLEAITLSLITTVILYFKPQLQEFSRKLSERDIFAIFQFGLIAFIILPILPNRGYGPYNALNPANIWLMVVMISALNLIGYVTLKQVGQRWGGPVLGILGGLVSSTATTLSFSRHSRSNNELSMTGALVVSIASAVVLIRIAFLVGIIHLQLLTQLAIPLLMMFLAGQVPAFLIWRQSSHQETPLPVTRNPVEMRQALWFGLLYAIILLAVSAGKDFLGDGGVYIVALVSGLTDVDAITLTNARLVETGTLAESQAAISILLAYISNLAFKLAIVGVLGTRKMLLWTMFCFICLAAPALLILL